MIGTRQKYELSYLLASFLRAGEMYDSARLDEFIARSVKPDILERRGYSPDHLRRCMIDNGFLRREPDGSTYWVSESFTGLAEEERKEEENKQNLVLRGACDEKAICPYCGVRYSGGVLLGHEQSVGRERNQVDSHRELARGVVDCRRVNSNVMRLLVS